ncbi:MAG: M1 family aminopeptidase, partial [Terriglobales bacterium]
GGPQRPTAPAGAERRALVWGAGAVQNRAAKSPLRALLALAACAALAVAAAAQTRTYKSLHVTLRIQPDFAARSIQVQETLTLRPLREQFQYFHLDCAGPVIDAITANGQPVSYQQRGQQLHIRLAAPLGPAQTLTLRIRYHVTPAAGLVFYPADLAQPGRATWLWTSGEPDENHHWLPIYDHPDDKLTADFFITAPRGDWAIANGQLLARRPAAGGGHVFHWAQTEPISSYLLAFYVGQWHRVDAVGPHGVPLQYDVPPTQSAAIARARYGRTAAMMAYDEQLTGVPYPWAKYDEVDNPGFFSGLENASETEFPGDYPQNATLANVRAAAPEMDVEIAHELSHQWFGDTVTCAHWSDLWLNEGFATFMQYTWDAHARGQDQAIRDWAQDADGYFAYAQERDHPVVDYQHGDPWNMFDPVTYNKGGFAIRMLEARLGAPAFWRAIHLYLTRYKFHPADTRNFELAVEESSGQNLRPFFQRWFYGRGYPVFHAAWSWRPAAMGAGSAPNPGGTVQLRLRQAPVHGLLYTGPLTLAAWVNGREQRRTVAITSADQTIAWSLAAKPEMVQMDPDHVLLKEVLWTKQLGEWRYEAAHAPWSWDRQQALDAMDRAEHDDNRATMAAFFARRVQVETSVPVADNALAHLAGLDPAAAQRLALQRLGSTVPAVRADAVTLLGHLHPGQATQPGERTRVRQLFRADPISSVRAAALGALVELDPARAQTYFTQALAMKSYHWQVENRALQLEAHRDRALAVPLLLRYAQVDQPPALRGVAIAQLGHFGGGNPAVAAVLRRALRGPTGMAQVRAALALAELRDRASLPAIQELAENTWIGFFKPAFQAAAEMLQR